MCRFISNSAIVFFFVLSVAFTQTLSIQGVIRDDTGVSIQGGYNIEFKLYTVETGGSSVWNETQNLTVTNGVYSALLGSVNSLEGLNYNIGYWLGIAIDGSEEMSPRTKLTLSPYAVMAGMNGTTNVFPQDGNVGIGTTTPTHKLQVNGILRVDTGGIYDVFLQGGSAAIGETRNLALLGHKSADVLYVNFDSEYRNGTILGGNVGIGTNTPTHKLHVQGKIRNNLNDGVHDVWIQGGSAGDGSTRNLALLGRQDKLYLNFGNEYQNGTILGGNVGIGTDNPQSKLTIAQGQIMVHEAEAGSGALRLGSAWGFPGIYGENPNLPLVLGSVSQKVYFKNCKVGIGKEIPNEGTSLHIKQQTDNAGLALENLNDTHFWRLSQNPTGSLLFDYSNGLYSWISVNNYNYYSGSDRNLKKNITPFGNILSKVITLEPKEYHFNQSNESDPKMFGFIAQDVEKIFPSLVEENQGSKGVAYSQFGVLAIAAIKEQQEIIDTLIERIEALEKQVNE